MFKKKNLDNVDFQYVYTVFDKVANKCIGLFYSPTDENMLRTSLPSVLMDFNLRDIEVHRIGRFECNTGKIESLSIKTVSLKKYIFPRSRLSSEGDDMSLEDVEKTVKEAKSKSMAKIDQILESQEKKEVINE